MDYQGTVFITSGANDRDEIEQIIETLRAQSIQVFTTDFELTPGLKREEFINKQIERSDVLVIFLSKKSLIQKNTIEYREDPKSEPLISRARTFDKPIIPVIEDGTGDLPLPYWATEYERVHYPSERGRLLSAISKHIKAAEQAKKDAAKDQSSTGKSVEDQLNENTDSEIPDEQTPFQNDTPSEFDYLGRKGLAIAVATWINRAFDESNRASDESNAGDKSIESNHIDESRVRGRSFILNIGGPWGIGKTTFLKLLRAELQNPSKPNQQTDTEDASAQPRENSHESTPAVKNKTAISTKETASGQWLVIEFNAWENRHVIPVWWPLMDQIYRQSVKELLKDIGPQKRKTRIQVFRIRIQEWFWRFYSGRKFELWSFLVALVVLALTILWIVPNNHTANASFLSDTDTVIKVIAGVFSLLSTIFVGTKFITQTTTIESAKAAETFLQFTPDPIEEIRRHFQDLVGVKINKPIMVFIDDLDRCDKTYVISLLESIQTLLNHQKVYYAIAADQRWLFAAYEKTYEEFKGSIKEPGKNIGYLFLEKVFQLSISIPQVPEAVRETYLDYLIGKNKLYEEIRTDTEKRLAGKDSEEQLIKAVEKDAKNPLEKMALREVAVANSASRTIEKQTVHFLRQFTHLMEPNPRAIKRLVTSYGVWRAIAILTDETIISAIKKRKQLALWIILQMRWPLLADYLEEHPEHLVNFKTQATSNDKVHPDLKDLIGDKDVKEVLTGNKIGVDLDQDALMSFASLKPKERTFGSVVQEQPPSARNKRALV